MLRARRRPEGEEPVIRVGERSAAADRHEAGVALLREDHSGSPEKRAAAGTERRSSTVRFPEVRSGFTATSWIVPPSCRPCHPGRMTRWVAGFGDARDRDHACAVVSARGGRRGAGGDGRERGGVDGSARPACGSRPGPAADEPGVRHRDAAGCCSRPWTRRSSRPRCRRSSATSAAPATCPGWSRRTCSPTPSRRCWPASSATCSAASWSSRSRRGRSCWPRPPAGSPRA